MRRMNRLARAFFLFVFLAQARGGTDDETSKKSQFNLFNPMPINLLRSYSSDRPSQSTGPYTVDAGHFYFEASAISYLYDEPERRITLRQWNVLPFEVRAGLTSNVELDFIYGGYLHLRQRDRTLARTERQSGFGDLTLQSKIALYGNDAGPIAFG